MTDLTDVNPAELRSFASQVSRAATDALGLKNYAFNTCSDTSGLNGLMSVVREPIEFVADVNSEVLRKCWSGLHGTGTNIRSAATDAESSDAAAAEHLSSLFPGAPPFYPDLTGPLSSPYGYEDDWEPNPTEPEASSDELTEEGIDAGGILGAIDWVWEQAMGESLIAALIEPIVGDPGRLAWLSEAYGELGRATYRVAWNLRSGTFNVSPHWNGDSGRAFEMHMLRWNLGLGGLGDAHQLISGFLADAYDFVFARINDALDLIESLLEKIGKMIAKKTLPIIGVIWTVWDATFGDLWDKIREIVDDVQAIKDTIQDAKDKIDELIGNIEEARAIIEALMEGVGDPLGAIRDLVAEAQSTVFSAEGQEGYEPSLTGAARAALLPISI